MCPLNTSTARRGFTLIELLIVITVILLLLATSTMVIGNIIDSAREKATIATIAKVNGLMQARLEAYQRAMERADLKSAVIFTKAYCRQAFPPEIDKFVLDQANEKTWEILARKTYLRAKFPLSFAEVCWFDGVPGTSADDNASGPTNFYPAPAGVQYYIGTPDPGEFGRGANDDLQPYATLLRERMVAPAAHRPETESAEMIYLILTAGDLFGVPAVGADEFASTEVRDTDGDGLPEFVDGWGRPLRFYRWPTRLVRCGESSHLGDRSAPPNGTSNDPPGPLSPWEPTYANLLVGTLPSLVVNDTSLQHDPDDGYGLIDSQIFNRLSSGSQAGARIKFEQLYHTPDTYWTSLIVSAGRDGELGLWEPVQFNIGANVFGHLAQPVTLGDPAANPINDDITNRRQ